jgi:hypothetical protein
MSQAGPGAHEAILTGLILAGLRCRLDDAALAECGERAAGGDVDWAALLGRAEAEQVGPLLHQAWHGARWLPPEAAGSLHRAYMQTGARNALVLRDLGRALDCLGRAGVPVLVLKGAALAEPVYRNPALRPMADIDLLVAPPDAQRALSALAETGRRPEREELAPGMRLRFDNEVALVAGDPLVTPIEIHWSLLDAPFYQARLDQGWLWSTAAQATLAGRAAQVLGPEAELMYLCAHVALHHGGHGLLWHHDVAERVHCAGAGLDWPLLLARAAAADLLLPLQTVLARVARDWGTCPPAAAWAQLLAMRPSAAETRVFARRRAAGRAVAARFADDVAELPTWRQRLAFATRNLLPGPAYMRARYGVRHPLALALAYPYRWGLGLRSLIGRPHGE